MKVAGYQMCVDDERVEVNYDRISRAIEEAGRNKADILLTPEGALSGYHNRFPQDEVQRALEELRRQAATFRVGLALGTCYFETPGECYNQLRFYDKEGIYLGFHSKILLCSNSLDEPYSGEITYFLTKKLEVFEFQGLKIGGLLCNDLWANPGCTPQPDPHLTHQLAKLGAKIIFHAVNGGRADQESINLNRAFHESNQRLRAIADRLYIVTVDNAYPITKDNSCSGGVISDTGEYLCKLPVRGESLFFQDIF